MESPEGGEFPCIFREGDGERSQLVCYGDFVESLLDANGIDFILFGTPVSENNAA